MEEMAIEIKNWYLVRNDQLQGNLSIIDAGSRGTTNNSDSVKASGGISCPVADDLYEF